MKAVDFAAVALIVAVVCAAAFLAGRWYVIDKAEKACAAVPNAGLNPAEQLAAATICSAWQKVRSAA